MASHRISVALRAIFAVEYVARIVCASRRLSYVGSAAGVVDLAAVVLDFGPLKLLRLLKLIVRASAFDRLAAAVFAVRHELVATGVCAGALIYGAAVGIYYCERAAQPEAFGSIPDALWWGGHHLNHYQLRRCGSDHAVGAAVHCRRCDGGARDGGRSDRADRCGTGTEEP